MKATSIVIGVLCFSIQWSARGAVVEFDNNRAGWQNAVGSHTTINFLGFAVNTNITTQYDDLGVTFTDGIDLIIGPIPSFPNDGFGLNGAFDTIAVSFSQPITSIAVDYPGGVKFRLFSQGQEVYLSTYFAHSGPGHFAGVVSDQPFDAAVIFDPEGGVFIDDLHFGPPIPAPAVGAMWFVAAGLTCLGRRRRSAS